MTTPQRRDDAEPAPRTWEDIAKEQDGVIARRQALAAGLAPDAWTWRLTHDWQSPLRGIAVTHTGVVTDRETRWSAVLRFRKDARLSGDGALVEHGLKRLEVKRLDVVHAGAGGLGSLTTSNGTTVRPHRMAVPESWRTSRAAMPLVNVHVATLHAADWAPSDRAAELRVVMAVQQRLTTVPLLRAAAAEIPQLSRRSLVEAVLDDVELGAHALVEVDFLRFCRQHSIPPPDRLQVLVRADGKRYLDARWDRQKVNLELDGAQHLWAESWNTDTLRSLEVAVAGAPGDRQIRLTSFNLRHDGARVAELLRRLLV